jgi:hypothetical protein
MATRERAVTLRQDTYEALEAEAQRRHVAPDDLADELVRQQLPADAKQMRDALDALGSVSARMPEVDAVQLMREGRDELERRASRWQPS